MLEPRRLTASGLAANRLAAAGGEFAADPWAWSWAPGSVGGEAPLWNEAALWQDFSLDPLVVETREASMYS